MYSEAVLNKKLDMNGIKAKPIVKERLYYLDVLRILCILSVIFIHSAATEVANMNSIGSFHWWVSNVFDSISRWAVPVFFMISGALILGSQKEESVREFYHKRVIRLLIPFVIWSSVYSLCKHCVFLPDYPSWTNMIKLIFTEFLFDKAYIHFWFMYVIIGVYLVTPFIKRSVNGLKKNELLFCISAWFGVTVAYKFAKYILFKYFGLNVYLPILDIPFFTGYIGYFLIGYYLNKYPIRLRNRIVVYVLGLASLIAMPIVTYFISLGKEVLDETYYANFSIVTFFMSIAIFILFKNIDWNKLLNVKIKRLIKSISGSVFGIYFIHLLIQILVLRIMFNYVKADNITTILIYIINGVLALTLSYITVKLVGLNHKVGKILFG